MKKMMTKSCFRASARRIVLLGLLCAWSAAAAADGIREPVSPARNRLVRAVRENGADALPALIRALSDERNAVRLTAAHLIAEFEPPLHAGFEAGLRHEDVNIRRAILRGLTRQGLLVDYWFTIVSDDSPIVQRETRLALLDAHIAPLTGEARAKVMAEFARAYREGSPETRLHVAEMLAHMLEPGDKGWAILERATDARDDDVAFRAAQLVVEPTLERMQALAREGEWAELIRAFADLDPADWPDREMAAEAFRLRGRAYHRMERGDAARADLERATAIDPNRRDLTLLGHVWRDLLDNNERAAETYLRAIEAGGGQRAELYAAVRAAAGVLRDLERYDEALEMLALADADAIRRSGNRLTGRIGYQVNQAVGRILNDQGRIAEAIEHYRETLQLGGFSVAQRNSMQRVLDELEAR